MTWLARKSVHSFDKWFCSDSQPGVFYVLPEQGSQSQNQGDYAERGISTIQYTTAGQNYSPNYHQSPLMIQSQAQADPNHQVQIEVENSAEDIVYQTVDGNGQPVVSEAYQNYQTYVPNQMTEADKSTDSYLEKNDRQQDEIPVKAENGEN